MGKEFSHFDHKGNAVMVDVSGKEPTFRTAVATGYISVGAEIMAAVTGGNVKKRRCSRVARVAGIMGGEADFFSDSNVPSAANPEVCS